MLSPIAFWQRKATPQGPVDTQAGLGLPSEWSLKWLWWQSSLLNFRYSRSEFGDFPRRVDCVLNISSITTWKYTECCFDSHANSAVSLNYNVSKPNIYSFLAASITLLNILAIQWNLYTTVTLLRHIRLVLLLCVYIKIPNEAKTIGKNNMRWDDY